ncbi:hypothetical protein MMC31_007060 [Peltigera leucophlebia]|nr:hypothetical protein [Peltigera leucophlebia]
MTGVKSKRGKAPQSSVDCSSDNTPHLNDTSWLLAPPLDELLESCLYTACKTAAGLNSSAQAAAETEDNHHGRTENVVPVDATSIKASQSTNTMDGDNLTDHLYTLPVLAGMEIVRKSSGFFSNFDWTRCEWRLLNKKKTTHALALKGEAGLAQLFFIGTTKYAGLLIGDYDGWTMKIRLSEEDYKELKRKLIQHGVLSSVWNLNQLSDEIGVSTKREYVQAQMQTLSESDDTSLMTKTLDDGYFPFTYNDDEIKMSEEEFPEPGWTVYDFSRNKIVAIEA